MRKEGISLCFLINASLRSERNIVCTDAAACLTANPWRSNHPNYCATVSSPWAGQSLFIPLLYWRWDFGANIGNTYVSPKGTIYTHINGFPIIYLWDQLTFQVCCSTTRPETVISGQVTIIIYYFPMDVLEIYFLSRHLTTE